MDLIHPKNQTNRDNQSSNFFPPKTNNHFFKKKEKKTRARLLREAPFSSNKVIIFKSPFSQALIKGVNPFFSQNFQIKITTQHTHRIITRDNHDDDHTHKDDDDQSQKRSTHKKRKERD